MSFAGRAVGGFKLQYKGSRSTSPMTLAGPGKLRLKIESFPVKVLNNVKLVILSELHAHPKTTHDSRYCILGTSITSSHLSLLCTMTFSSAGILLSALH
jgi:hypothetical protein